MLSKEQNELWDAAYASARHNDVFDAACAEGDRPLKIRIALLRFSSSSPQVS